MIQKIKNVLSSIRFWEVLIAVIIYVGVSEGIIINETAVGIAQIIYTTLGISVGIGTADKLFAR